MGELVWLDLGRAAYRPALSLQQRLVDRVRQTDGREAYLVLVEHDPPVITLGRRARAEHLLTPPAHLAAEGIELIESQRGGDITWHGPGQLVAYPIVRLLRERRTLHGHIRALEEAVLRLLAGLGLAGQRRDGLTGVWAGHRKVAAIGVAVSRWVTYHGLALNVVGDLGGFRHIIPCGIRDAGVASLSALLCREVPMEEAKRLLLEELRRMLGFDGLRQADPRELGAIFAAQGRQIPTGSALRPRLPRWLRRKAPTGRVAGAVQKLLTELSLPTVCVSAHCPNRPECFARGTATFMILGDRCTRSCRFCAVGHGRPLPPDPEEPRRVAEAASRLGLRHVVVTSVTRDDLPDGGAGHFAQVVRAIRARLPQSTIEVLTPDFRGDPGAVSTVIAAAPDVFNHNVETVPRLYPAIRPQADYRRSLAVLEHARRCAPPGRLAAKSGLMVGLGETREEITQVLRDLRSAGCDSVTIGQYLAPSADHAPVRRFVEPAEFAELEAEARDLGFVAVAAGPFIRSSYRAGELLPGGDRLRTALPHGKGFGRKPREPA